MKYLSLIFVLLLAACGSHHDSNNGGATTPPPTTTPPVSMVDAFFTAVMNLIGDGAEKTTEPVATDSVAATTPEDTEPAVVK